jgi:hypothetical protein
MGNTGLIVANEPDLRRQVPLSHNLSRLGVLNTIMTRYQAQEFTLRQNFDYVLADVPCSGEGRFRFPGKTMWYGESKREQKLLELQKRIISRAFDLLRTGGVMVYSTCTYNPLENEEIVDALLKERRDAELLPIECGFPYAPGVLSWNRKVYERELQKAARFYPHQLDSVGFFMARLLDESEEKALLAISMNVLGFLRRFEDYFWFKRENRGGWLEHPFDGKGFSAQDISVGWAFTKIGVYQADDPYDSSFRKARDKVTS